jgi:hypothetical protein
MTTTITTAPTNTSETRKPLWAAGGGYAVAGAAAAVVVAAVARAAGVSLEIAGEEVLLGGFAVLAFGFSMAGVVLAAGLRRWAKHPQRTFVRTTIALVVLSFGPDLLTADIDVATRITLMLTHLAAAAVVIPGVARRLG